MKKTILLLLSSAFIFFLSCHNTESPKTAVVPSLDKAAVLKQANKVFAVLPTESINSENPTSAEKIALGKSLYFDNRLSENQTQSCNTCHNVATYGVDNLATSKGDNGRFGNRNSPSTFNAALHISQFWDGRNKDVEQQAGGPILNPKEMAIPNEEFVLNRLKKVPEYKEMFAKAYPNDKKPFTYLNLTRAIGAFERTLITPSKFDEYLAGNQDALNEQETQGLQSFMDVGCTTCHSGSVLGGNILMKFGVNNNYWELTKSTAIDSGKYSQTKADADMFVFKVQSLRNIEKTFPYFHDGSIAKLDDVVKIMGKLQLNKDLSAEETANILAFLKTLTGKIPENALMTEVVKK